MLNKDELTKYYKNLNTKEHDELIQEICKYLEKKDFSIEADHIKGYEKPEEIENHIPDIYAFQSYALGQKEIIIIIEVETDIDEDQSKKQINSFINWKNGFSNRHVFVVDIKNKTVLEL